MSPWLLTDDKLSAPMISTVWNVDNFVFIGCELKNPLPLPRYDVKCKTFHIFQLNSAGPFLILSELHYYCRKNMKVVRVYIAFTKYTSSVMK